MAAGPLAGRVVCATGLDAAARTAMRARVEAMGGVFSPALSKDVSVLVVLRALDSEKYAAACAAGIPCVLPSFLDTVAKRASAGVFGEDSFRRVVAECARPVLHECVLCVTGVPAAERLELARLVRAAGGAYTPDLTSACTHLLTGPGTIAGPKVAFAQRAGIRIAPVSWLHECISRQTLLPVPIRESTLGDGDSAFALTHPTQSFDYGDLCAEDVSRASGDGLFPQYFAGLHFFVGSASISETVNEPRHDAPGSLGAKRPAELDTGVPTHADRAERLALLRRLIIAAGGVRHCDAAGERAALITHYVVPGQFLGAAELSELRALAASAGNLGRDPPAVVHDQWLIACFYARALVEIGPFVVQSAYVHAAECGELESSQSSSTQTSCTAPSQCSVRSASQSSRPASVRDVRDAILGRKPALRVTAVGAYDFSSTALPVAAPSSLPPLGSVRFAVHAELRAQAVQAAQLADALERLGALVLDDGPGVPADYVLCPPAIYAPPQSPGAELRTALWASGVVRASSILPAEDHDRPLSVYSGASSAAILAGLVFTTTGFGSARPAHTALLLWAGASVTDALSAANTHVLAADVAAHSPKLAFARARAIPTVSVDALRSAIAAGDVALLCGAGSSSHAHASRRGQSSASSLRPPAVPLGKPPASRSGLSSASLSVQASGSSVSHAAHDEFNKGGLEETSLQAHDRILSHNAQGQLSKSGSVETRPPAHGPTVSHGARNGLDMNGSVDSSLQAHALIIDHNPRGGLTVHPSAESSLQTGSVKGASTGAKGHRGFASPRPVARRPAEVVFAPLALERAHGGLAAAEPTDNLPLSACVVALSPQLWARRDELHAAASQLGASFAWTYDKAVTHYVHAGPSAGFAEIDRAQRSGCVLVTPAWLTDCLASNERLDESRYAPSVEPSKPRAIELPAKPAPAPNWDDALERDRRALAPARGTIQYDVRAKLDVPREACVQERQLVFVFSQVDAETRLSFGDALGRIGAGRLLPHAPSGAGWDADTTHLVIGSLVQNEKLLSALAASGVWVLRPSYVEAVLSAASDDQARLCLDNEAAHEWRPDADMGPEVSALAAAGPAWRAAAAPAFSGWRVLLLCDTKRAPSMASVLAAGGASVLLPGDPGAPATHGGAVSFVDLEALCHAGSAGANSGPIGDPALAGVTHVLYSSAGMRARLAAGAQAALGEALFHPIDVIGQRLLSR